MVRGSEIKFDFEGFAMSVAESLTTQDVPSKALPLFVIITFTITWGLVGFAIFFPDQAVSWFGEISGSNPVFFLATWAPAIAARKRGSSASAGVVCRAQPGRQAASRAPLSARRCRFRDMNASWLKKS